MGDFFTATHRGFEGCSILEGLSDAHRARQILVHLGFDVLGPLERQVIILCTYFYGVTSFYFAADDLF